MASIEKSLDTTKLEAEATEALPIKEAPSVHSEPMPDHIEHLEGVPRVGSLTAAVMQEFESAASSKALETIRHAPKGTRRLNL
jgi:hypothetical protein